MKNYNTFTTLFAAILLLLSTLACGQLVTPIPEPTPDNSLDNTTPTRVLTSTPRFTTVPKPTTVVSSTQTVVSAVVNVRFSPDNSSAVVGVLEAGTVVEVIKCAGSWCQIKDPPGYVWRGCLQDNPDQLRCEAKP